MFMPRYRAKLPFSRTESLASGDMLTSCGWALKVGGRPLSIPHPTGSTTYQKAKYHSSKAAPDEAFPGLLRGQLWTESKFLKKGILITIALGIMINC